MLDHVSDKITIPQQTVITKRKTSGDSSDLSFIITSPAIAWHSCSACHIVNGPLSSPAACILLLGTVL